MKIIAFGTLKGGTGKTMTALNIAGILAERHRVLLIDVDPQSNLTDNVGVDTTAMDAPTVRDIFENWTTALPEVLITPSPIDELPNLDIIASHIRLTATELRLVSAPNRESILERWIRMHNETLNRYDYVIIDTNPSMGLVNQNAFKVADSIILVSDASKKSIQGAQLFNFLWGEIRDAFNLPDNVRALLLNNVDARTNKSKKIRDFYENDPEFEELVLNVEIRNRTKLGDTENEYLPINVLYPDLDACWAYRCVISELMERGILDYHEDYVMNLAEPVEEEEENNE